MASGGEFHLGLLSRRGLGWTRLANTARRVVLPAAASRHRCQPLAAGRHVRHAPPASLVAPGGVAHALGVDMGVLDPVVVAGVVTAVGAGAAVGVAAAADFAAGAGVGMAQGAAPLDISTWDGEGGRGEESGGFSIGEAARILDRIAEEEERNGGA